MDKKKNLIFKNLYCFFLTLFVISSGISVSVFAVDDDEEAFTLEEITVTAEKREAELQKVPMDISVVRPDDMARVGINTAADLDKVLPELSINVNAGSSLQVNLRNVQNLIWNTTYETTVAMHLDGIQLTRVNGFDNLFYDLQRVEVLKGPQGTLYGRGSTAGSTNIVTQKAILDEFSGYLTVEAGNYSLYRTEGAINVPVTDKLALRFAGRSYKHDGYSDSGYTDADAWGGRVALTWAPTEKDSFTATFDFEGFEDDGYGYTGYYYATYGGLSIAANPDATSYPLNYSGTVISLPWQTSWAVGNMADTNWNDNNSWGIMAQYEHEFDFAYLTTVYGHRSLHEDKAYMYGGVSVGGYYPDGDYSSTDQIVLSTFTPYMYVDSYNSGKFDSLEVRLTSKSTINQGDSFEWIIGGMAQEDSITEYASPWYVYYVDLTTKSKGLFGQASYKILNGLTLTAGYRYSWDEKEYYGRVFTDDDDDDFYAELLDPDQPRYYRNYSWNEDSYKINLSWEATDNLMTYLQYAKGYKTGNVSNNGDSIDPEFLDAYELGVKTRFLDNRLQLNTALYYYKYDNYNQWTVAYKCKSDVNGDHACDDINGDYQLTSLDYEYYENVGVAPGGSEQKGLNASVMYMPTAKDVFSVSASYSKNKYDDYNIKAAILEKYADADNVYTTEAYQDMSGLEFGGSPIRGNISYTHTEFLGLDTLVFSTTAYYEGEGVDETLNIGQDNVYTMPGIDEYWLMDASLTYNSSMWVPEGMNWSARLWCNNVFNSTPISSLYYVDYDYIWGDTFPAQSGYVSGTYVQPRTYGLTLTFNF